MRTFRFKCGKCDQIHEGSPSVAFDSPVYFDMLSAEEREKQAYLDSDFCSLNDQEFFIRTLLEVPIHDADEPFLWGVWMSVSGENYRRYQAVFRGEAEPEEGEAYVGWISNRLPGYPDTIRLLARARVQAGDDRPILELKPDDHPLFEDWRDGMSQEDAARIFNPILHAHES